MSDSAYNGKMDIRFSRHARNRLRLYRLSQTEVQEAIVSGSMLDRGDKRESTHGKLRVIWVMVGDYALVLTVVRMR